MAGRKKKPVELKIIQGTYRPDRDNPNAPKPSPDEPVAPAELTDREQEYFAEIVVRLKEYGLASASYTRTIALAAKRMAEIEKADKAIEEHGVVYTTVNKHEEVMVKANPAVRMRSEAMRHLQSLLAEMGLTPAARSKVGGSEKKKSGNPFLEELG